MFPCKFALSTRSTTELAARRAIRGIEGKDIEDVSEYLDPEADKYEKMVEWIRRDLGATTLRYQRDRRYDRGDRPPAGETLPALLDGKIEFITERRGEPAGVALSLP